MLAASVSIVRPASSVARCGSYLHSSRRSVEQPAGACMVGPATMQRRRQCSLVRGYAAQPERSAWSGPPQPPRFEGRWEDVPTEEKREYLQSVRKFYGVGLLYEREVVDCPRGRSDAKPRTTLALVDPRLKWLWESHPWCDGHPGNGEFRAEIQRSYVYWSYLTSNSKTMSFAELAVWEALGRGAIPSGLPRLKVQPRDGCPANYLARNLYVTFAGGSESGSVEDWWGPDRDESEWRRRAPELFLDEKKRARLRRGPTHKEWLQLWQALLDDLTCSCSCGDPYPGCEGE